MSQVVKRIELMDRKSTQREKSIEKNNNNREEKRVGWGLTPTPHSHQARRSRLCCGRDHGYHHPRGTAERKKEKDIYIYQ